MSLARAAEVFSEDAEEENERERGATKMRICLYMSFVVVFSLLEMLLPLFVIAWHICGKMHGDYLRNFSKTGAIWIYSAWGNTEAEQISNVYCDATMLNMSFSILTLTLGLFAIGGIVQAVICCCAMVAMAEGE